MMVSLSGLPFSSTSTAIVEHLQFTLFASLAHLPLFFCGVQVSVARGMRATGRRA